MPVVILTAPSRPDTEETAVLGRVTVAVSEAPGLPPDAVHAILVPATHASTGTTSAEPWPVAVLHGRARAESSMAAAVDLVTDVLVEQFGVPPEQVWVQWAV